MRSLKIQESNQQTNTTMGHIEEVASRLKGLREALGLTVKEFCDTCGIDEGKYMKYESAETGIPVSTVNRIAKACQVEVNALLFGEEPKMSGYYVTRKGCGEFVERRNWYKYQSLAIGFAKRAMEPYLVTVLPNEHSEVHLSTHEGQEFNYIESGTMELHLDSKVIRLNQGDAIMFDSRKPHGMRAIGDEPLKFIAIIL